MFLFQTKIKMSDEIPMVKKKEAGLKTNRITSWVNDVAFKYSPKNPKKKKKRCLPTFYKIDRHSVRALELNI